MTTEPPKPLIEPLLIRMSTPDYSYNQSVYEPYSHGFAQPPSSVSTFGLQETGEKVNELIVAVNNIARAVETMAHWLVAAQTGFNAKDAEGIVNIVRGRLVP